MRTQLDMFPELIVQGERIRFAAKYNVGFIVNPYWYSYASAWLAKHGDFTTEAYRLPEYKGDLGKDHILMRGGTILVPTPMEPDKLQESRRTKWPDKRKPFDDIEVSEL